jgi:cyclopropane fatty-acyl-phospholipid synthase-like methyltransferase
MAYLYGPHYARIWEETLVTDASGGLADSLAAELGDYYGVTRAEAAARMVETWNSRTELAAARLDVADVERYYREEEHPVFTGMYWHSLEPNTWALVSVAALHAAQRFGAGQRLLDFGHGVGSTGLLFARHGFDVTMLDISEPMHRFAKWRFARRGLNARLLLGAAEIKVDERFDVIVSLDVMEHLIDPLGAIRQMTNWLAPGGLLILNIAFGLDRHQPEHLLRRRLGILNAIRAIGLQRANLDNLLVFYNQPLPRPRLLARAVDAVFASWEDARNSKFRPLAALSRRLRVHEAPGLLPPTELGVKTRQKSRP